jgi:hypothetical protein
MPAPLSVEGKFEISQVLAIAIIEPACDAVRMPKPRASIPEVLPTSPISLACPLCGAKPMRDCIKISGNLSIIHVARIAAAASADKKTKRKRR